MPPLRRRPRDIELLSRFFLEVSSLVNGRAPKRLADSARQKLLSWSWPGNVRELENVIERAVLLSKADIVDAADIAISGFEGDLNSFRRIKARYDRGRSRTPFDIPHP